MRYTNSLALALALSNSASAAAIKPGPDSVSQVLALLNSLLTGAENLESLLVSLLPSAPSGLPTTVHPTLPTAIPGLPTGFPGLPTALPSISLPSVSLPSISLPSVSLPSVSLPSISIPTPSLPSISLPSLPVPTALPTGIPVPSNGHLPPVFPSVSLPTGFPSIAFPPLPFPTSFPPKGLPPIPVTSSFFPSKGLPPITTASIIPPGPVPIVPRPSTGVTPLEHEARSEETTNEQQLQERQFGFGLGAGFGAVLRGLVDLTLALSTAATAVGDGVNLGSAASQKQVCSTFHDFVQEQTLVQNQLASAAASLGPVERLTLGLALDSMQAAARPLARGIAASAPACSAAATADQKALAGAVGSTLCAVGRKASC